MSPFAQSFSQKSTPRLNLSWMNIGSFAVLILLCGVYIFHVNHVVSEGYQIRALESQISELSLQNQKLEVVSQQAESLQNVAHAVTMMGFVRADQPTYLSSAAPSYAMAK
ncbi:MAG: DUF948 domain-containing protein [Patescibacteria group bacterium]